MKKYLTIVFFILFSLLFLPQKSVAQCSICTKTAEQLGEKPARGLNAGILYLAAVPFICAGYIIYRWRKNNKSEG